MQSSKLILRTKLQQPRAVPELLERPRLIERLRANLGSPVTMVAADAGCGKTTLIADFVRGQSRPSIWYQLDHTDADPVMFLSYIAHGIRNIFPGFGDALFLYLDEAGEDLVRFPERTVDLLLNEVLEAIEQPFILVLDDYHHIGRETIVHKLVDRILQYSSDLLHVIITTRDLPPLSITRLRSQSSAMLLTRDDLLFTDDEVRELFRRTLNIELGAQEIAEYRSRTHGWITGLQLVRQIAEREMHSGKSDGKQGGKFDGRPDLLEMLQRSERDIFDYFAEEVLSRESPETEKLFLYLSLLDPLPLDICSRLYPNMRCSALLPELAKKNVFLTVSGDAGDAGNEGSVETYRFHPLFRDCLRRRLRSEIGRSGMAAEQNRIAEQLLAGGRWEMALAFFIEAENHRRAAELLAEKGGELISTGAFASLSHLAAQIPEREIEAFPRLLLYQAEIARLQGERKRASALLHRAVKLFSEKRDSLNEAEALHSLASIARRKGKLAEAFTLLERAEALAESGSETLLKCLNTRGLCYVAEGKWAEAEQQFRVALELAEKLGSERYIRLVAHNLALAPGFRGDFAEALRWFKRIFREGEPGKQLPQEAIGHLNVARLHLYRGEFAEVENHLESAHELCQLYNLKALRGEIFETYANFYREKREFARAAEYYDRAVNAYEEADIDIASRELTEEKAKFLINAGELSLARSLLEKLIISLKTAANEARIRTAELCLCRVDLMEGKTGGLAEKVNAIREFFDRNGNYYDEALAAMLLAEIRYRFGQMKEMIEPVRRVLDLSARFDYEHWLKQEIERNPEIFAYEDVFERLPPDLRECVKKAGMAAASSPEKQGLGEIGSASGRAIVLSPTRFADLTIKVLGPVDIFRDSERPFAPDAWPTRRARDIFCYIATSRHRRVAKDILIDTFWPGEDPAGIEKNFHPTISHIRKALNSRQPYKQNFIVFRDGAYQLEAGLSYSIDTEDFELLIAEAEKAKREKDAIRLRTLLDEAYRLYRGDFMEGSYDKWVEERRHYYYEQFIRVVGALARLSFSERQWSAALKYANAILADDPFREDIHRLVMKILAAQGKPAAVKAHFEKMKKLLKAELGIAPSAETERLFYELLK